MSPARTLAATTLAATLAGCATRSPLCHSDAQPGALDTWKRALDRDDLHPVPTERLGVVLGAMIAECLWPVDAP